MVLGARTEKNLGSILVFNQKFRAVTYHGTLLMEMKSKANVGMPRLF